MSFTITALVDATIVAELKQMQEFGVFEGKRRSDKPPNEKVISTKMFHKAKGDEVRSRIVAREFADGVFVPEHHAGTPPTWALKLVISRMMSQGRTRQLASHDVSVAFFHAWLEKGVWVKPPKDLKLNDDWLWYVLKAFYGLRIKQSIPRSGTRDVHHVWVDTAALDSLAGRHGDDFFYREGEVDEMILASFKAKVLPRLGPGASTEGTILRRILRWSEEGVHMAPDAKHVENLARLLEVKGVKPSPTPSSRATGRGQRDVLEPLTAAEATVFRRGTGIRQRNSLKTCRRLASFQ